MNIEEKLKGKNILFLSVQAFNYEKYIASHLRSFGANVDYFDERPANSIYVKGIIRVRRTFYQKKINNYYKSILNEIANNHYDYLFVIKGEVVPAFFLEALKQQQPKCIFLYYTWDSFKNNINALAIQKYFDKTFTFDNEDAQQYGMHFRPLFFLNEYAAIKNINNKHISYNLLFLGTAHSDRYRISNEIIQWCHNHNLTTYAYYYMQGRIIFFYKKYLDKSFKKFDYSKLSFISLSLKRIVELYTATKVVLDINHPNQSGLTMRTFEALGAGKKLITTNANIKNYSFYNENNILIIDRDKPKVDIEFFKTDFQDIEKELLQNMSINGWLKSIFIQSPVNYWLKKRNLLRKR